MRFKLTSRMLSRLSAATPEVKEHYNFNAGVNTITANESLPPEASPYARNHRYNSRETIKTRKGPASYTVPIGEALGTVFTTAPTSGQAPSVTVKWAAKFSAARSESLTKVELNLKNIAAGAGPLIVEIWSDAAGSPGTLLASSSIAGGSITSSYQYLPARFLLAPALTAATSYWIVAYIQADGSGAYAWGAAAGTTAKSSTNNAAFATSLFDLDFKTYQAPANPVLGAIRFQLSNGTEISILANKLGVYSVNDSTGAVTQIFAGNNNALRYKFAVSNDTLFAVNGLDAPQQWNGIAAAMSAVPGSPPIASNVIVYKNRLFFLSAASTRMVFSEPADYTTYLAVNFQYIPAPNSPDPVQTLTIVHDNLIIRTRRTKWVLYGSDLSSFTLRLSTALSGVVNPDCVVSHNNMEYSVSDAGVLEFNGSSEVPILPMLQPDFDAIVDKTKMSMALSGNYLRVYYPTPGSAYNNQCFVFDLQYKIAFIDNQTPFNKFFTMFLNGAETLVLGSSLVGGLLYADQQYSDMGAPIPFKYWTKYESYGRPEQTKLMRRFFPKFIGQVGNYVCSIFVDFNRVNAPSPVDTTNMQLSGAHLGVDFILGTSTLGGNGNPEPELEVEGEFRERQFRFEHSGVDQPVELYGHTDYFFRQRSL